MIPVAPLTLILTRSGALYSASFAGTIACTGTLSENSQTTMNASATPAQMRSVLTMRRLQEH